MIRRTDSTIARVTVNMIELHELHKFWWFVRKLLTCRFCCTNSNQKKVSAANIKIDKPLKSKVCVVFVHVLAQDSSRNTCPRPISKTTTAYKYNFSDVVNIHKEKTPAAYLESKKKRQYILWWNGIESDKCYRLQLECYECWSSTWFLVRGAPFQTNEASHPSERSKRRSWR